MVLGFLQSKDDVATLIAKKNYSKAIEVIREQLKTQKQDPRLRLQLSRRRAWLMPPPRPLLQTRPFPPQKRRR